MWPVAAVALAREEDDEPAWSRVHVRQALAFGLLATFAYPVLMALPLLVIIAFPSVGTGPTVGIYAAGIVLDLAASIAWLIAALAWSSAARRGRLFRIPLVSAFVDRIVRRRGA